MTDLMRNFIIGLVSIVALIGFAALLMSFGELEIFSRNQYRVNVNMNVAGGLRQGSPVELNGVHIGTVGSVRLRDEPDEPEFPVQVVAMIDEHQLIPQSVAASVNRSLLAGTAILQLAGPRPRLHEENGYLPTDGKAAIYVTERSLIDQVREELDVRTQPLIDALEQFNRLSETYITLGENLNDLVRPLDPSSDDDGAPNVREAMARFNEMLDEARAALQLVNKWLEDEQLLADAKAAVGNARTLTEQASKTIEQYGRLAEKLEGDTDDILAAILPVADDLSATLDEVRRLMKTASEGRGTIAQLLNNPNLYQSLQDAAERLEQALTDVQLFIEKARKEGLPTRIW